MLKELVDLVGRLNLSAPENMIGAHFPQIMALLSIVFGGAFLLYAWKQRNYFLGITGFLVGGWAGLLLKGVIAPEGQAAPFLYLGICAIAGAYLTVSLQRCVGMLLGGFSVAITLMVFFPESMDADQGNMMTLGMAFLMGGGLGAISPKFFFVFNCSLIGACFVTYGVSQGILGSLAGDMSADLNVFLHLAVFLPLFLFGLVYQLTAKDEETLRVVMARPESVPARN